MSKVTMIIGVPASGKSTIMRSLLSRGLWHFDKSVKFIPNHWQLPDRCIIGRYDDPTHPFPGTDRMSMACQRHVIRFILQNPAANFVFEGDRLGNDTMVKSMQVVGVDLQVLHIHVSDETLAQRRASRNQREAFVRGRHTKIANMVSSIGRAARSGQPVIRFENDKPEQCERIVDYLMEQRL